MKPFLLPHDECRVRAIANEKIFAKKTTMEQELYNIRNL
jgi:hypothetical protein